VKPPDPATQDSISDRFSLVRGGPTHELQRRFGLLGADGLPSFRAGFLVSAFAWLPLLALTSFDPGAADLAQGQGFFNDFGSYARSLLAPLFLIVADRMTDRRLSRLLENFETSGLLAPESRAAFMALLAKADRRTGARVAESLMLMAAIALAFLSLSHGLKVVGASWVGTHADGEFSLTAAGWWQLFVSLPLFFYLTLRWLWRFIVWTSLLWGLRGLPLRLVASHPDRAGGLGFLALFPQMFTPLAFALSCVVAAASLQEVLYAGVTFEQLRMAAIGWVVVVLIVFVGPVTVFAAPLMRLREQALIDFSGVVARHNRAAEQELGAATPDQLLGSATISSLSDINVALESIRSIRPLPVELRSVVPLIVVALLPMVAVASVEVPIIDLLKGIIGKLL
jgi:hypothetical protein